jgi:hypothetical protein
MIDETIDETSRLRGEKMAEHDCLTKISVMSGLQCHKRLWMSKHDPIPREKIAPTITQGIGTEVGTCAHNLFPDGQLVNVVPWEHDAALARTRKLMDNPNIPAIFEAAFEAGGICVRVDIIERLPRGRWKLYEVKASTELDEDEHLPDIAIQAWAMEQVGHKVTSPHLLHINKKYVRGAKGIDWKKLLTSVDVSKKIKPIMKKVPAWAKEFLTVLRGENPVVEPSDHCHAPYTCEFWERCTSNKPDDWVGHLPGLSAEAKERLQAASIEAIKDIPEDFKLSKQQKIVRDVIVSGKEWLSKELASVLAAINPPCLYLDFETMNPAIPLYTGTRPYQRQPFQWSLHRLDAGGELTHSEFLAAGADDPRRAFTESLIKELTGTEIPIVVYSGFESSVLNDMAELYPKLAKPISKIQKRLHDLYGIVRNHYCHPNFMGSYSIKDVGPVLAHEVTYDDLELVRNGGDASTVFEALAKGAIAAKDVEKARQALLTYCKRDTKAMVHVHEALVSKAPRQRKRGVFEVPER